MEDFVPYETLLKLEKKGYKGKTIRYHGHIYDVLKWLREEKNIDVEIHADVGMLGNKVYTPFISTYTEFTLETSPDVVRYRQKKFNSTTKLPHEIIPALVHFKEWEQAVLTGIEYVIDNNLI